MTRAEVIHLYWYYFDDDRVESPLNFDLLDDVEMAQHAAIKQPARANHFAYRHGLLRQLLSLHCDLPAKELVFDIGPNGKPSLAGNSSSIHFNTSQSGNVGIIAICEIGPLGVDIELSRSIDVAGFAQKILSPKERISFSSLTAEQQLPALFKFWTAKEALIKALGIGLDLNQLPHITLTDGSDRTGFTEWHAFELTGSLAADSPWHLATMSLESGFPQSAIVSIASQRKLPVKIRSAQELLAG
ncbi:MAG: 4'-phosphopantetheinyl transferase superfamily protein [Rhizobiaceae bacterium]